MSDDKVNDICQQQKINILIISGGGVRGIIPAEIIKYFTHLAGKDSSKLVDLKVGTSIGGIIVAMLSAKDTDGKQKYDSSKLVDFFHENGGKIFPPYKFSLFDKPKEAAPNSVSQGLGNLEDKISSFFSNTYKNLEKLFEGVDKIPDSLSRELELLKEKFASVPSETMSFLHSINSAKYPSEPKYNLLKEFLGDTKLSDTFPMCAVSYNFGQNKPYSFCSYKGQNSPKENYFLRDAADASSAAPTYFPIKEIENPQTQQKEYYVDGGVFANSPNNLAFKIISDLCPGYSRQNIFAVSIGTGNVNKTITPPSNVNAGYFDWLTKYNILDLLQSAPQEEEIKEGPSYFGKYSRIDVSISSSEEKLDDPSLVSILSNITKTYLATDDTTDKLKAIVECLESETIEGCNVNEYVLLGGDNVDAEQCAA